ncbi:MAG: primosomal protein N' [Bacillales bacterium]|nr:primosomal protein N' [Bacillales bacterium]
MIAEIILDLKAKSVDKPFSYLVPKRFLDIVEVGERCFVEFSSFKRMGIIVKLTEDHENNEIKLKEIDDMLDITPVLSKELIEIASYLSKTSCYPMISYLETMIPNVLKVNYSKKIRLLNKDDFKLGLIFGNEEVIDYKKIDKADLSFIKKAIDNKDIELIYDFKKKESVKYEKIITLETIPDKLTARRKEIVDYLIKHQNSSEWIKMRDDLSLSPDTIKRMVEQNIISVKEKEIYREIETIKPLSDKKVVFTDEQNAVFDTLKENLNHQNVFLLHGITGSGKTEIYLNLIEEVLKEGKEAIVLVPEISLTPMMVNRFKSRFKDDVAIFHSGLLDNTRYDEWRKVLRGEVKIAVGARSAVFAPFKNLGIIIIDEEHEQSYKQDTAPLYHAKDVAEKRCALHNCMLLLGSATPSIETYARCYKGVYNLVELKRRANNLGLPKTIVVDLNEEFKKGMKGNLSSLLKEEIEKRLEKGEQSLLLLNRRGYANYLMCRSCGKVEQCPNCSVSLTYHEYDKTLKCHYCGYEKHVNDVCSKCGSKYLQKVGSGTEKLEEELKSLFPIAKIIRMDNDTTRGKNAHEKLLYDFETMGDILIGTQMIAKGLDFPNVTLVGVINADQSLQIPDFRSKETTFELLTQVSGRAGRGDKSGLVIVQTYNKDHYAIKYGLLQDYKGFFNEEMKVRKIAKFSPFYNMAEIKIKSKDMKESYTEALKIKNELESSLEGEEVLILGPIPPTISKVDSYYIFNILIKYKIVEKLDLTLKKIYEKSVSNNILISIDRFPTSF